MPAVSLSMFKVVTNLGPKKPRRLSIKRPLLAPTTVSDLPSAHRLFLETSFTNLQSPSTAGALPQFPTTTTTTTMARSPQSLILPSKSFNLSLYKKTVSVDDRLDLIHDDWFGLAPLASPESLSEVSSISSRTASVVLQHQQQQQEFTPKLLMRRTPKISGDLYKCADNVRIVRNFEKLKIFGKLENNSNSSSNSQANSNSNLSYESAISQNHNNNNNNNSNNFDKILICGSNDSDKYQSAEDILDNVLTCAGCKEFFNDNTTFMETHFDFLEEQKMDEEPPVPAEDFDSDVLPNFAIDLNLDEQHRSQQFVNRNQSTPTTNNSVDSGSVCKTPSDLITKNVTFNPQVINIEETDFVIKSTNSSPNKQQQQQQRRSWNNLFQLNRNRHKSKSIELPTTTTTTAVPKTILSSSLKRPQERHESGASTSDFHRIETLPLLSGISSVATNTTTITTTMAERTSPSFIKRKKATVYPIEKTAIFKGESSV